MTHEPSEQDTSLDRLLERRLSRPRVDEAGDVCVDASTLASFVDGGLSLDERERVERHLAQCGDCRQALRLLMRAEAEAGDALAPALRGVDAQARPETQTLPAAGGAVVSATDVAPVSASPKLGGAARTGPESSRPVPSADGTDGVDGSTPRVAAPQRERQRSRRRVVSTWLPLAASLVAATGLWFALRPAPASVPAMQSTFARQEAAPVAPAPKEPASEGAASDRIAGRAPETAAGAAASADTAGVVAGGASAPSNAGAANAGAPANAGGAANAGGVAPAPTVPPPSPALRAPAEADSLIARHNEIAPEREGSRTALARPQASASRAGTAAAGVATAAGAAPAEKSSTPPSASRSADVRSLQERKAESATVHNAPATAGNETGAVGGAATASNASGAAAPPAGELRVQSKEQSARAPGRTEPPPPAAPAAVAQSGFAAGVGQNAAQTSASAPAPSSADASGLAAGAAPRSAQASSPAPVAARAKAVGVAGAGAAGTVMPMVTVTAPGGARMWQLTRSGVIRVSADSGASWLVDFTLPGARFRAGSAPSAEVCWGVGEAGVVVRRTAVEGWTRLTVPANEDFVAVSARDATMASIVSVTGVTYETRDGGRSWARK